MPALDSRNDFQHSVTSGSAPKLLVSVRSQTEFNDALAANIDIIDLKEPRHGPLSPAPPELWQQAVLQRDSHGRSHSLLSAALGESDIAPQIAGLLPANFTFAKAGPSGCDSKRDLEQLWATVRRRLKSGTRLVAVAYADHQAAGCRPPNEIFEVAAECGIKSCLLDTFRKDGQSTLDHLGINGLHDLQRTIRELDLWWALAGSLTNNLVPKLYGQGVQPDCFGVRGDVCLGDRTNRLSPDRIQIWKSRLPITQPNRDPSDSSVFPQNCRSNHPPNTNWSSDATQSRHGD